MGPMHCIQLGLIPLHPSPPHGMHVSPATCQDHSSPFQIQGLPTPNTLFSMGPHGVITTTQFRPLDGDQTADRNLNRNAQRCVLFVLSLIERPVVLWCLTCLLRHLGHNLLGIICSEFSADNSVASQGNWMGVTSQLRKIQAEFATHKWPQISWYRRTGFCYSNKLMRPSFCKSAIFFSYLNSEGKERQLLGCLASCYTSLKVKTQIFFI